MRRLDFVRDRKIPSAMVERPENVSV